jgi:hypothetical protein
MVMVSCLPAAIAVPQAEIVTVEVRVEVTCTPVQVPPAALVTVVVAPLVGRVKPVGAVMATAVAPVMEGVKYSVTVTDVAEAR